LVLLGRFSSLGSLLAWTLRSPIQLLEEPDELFNPCGPFDHWQCSKCGPQSSLLWLLVKLSLGLPHTMPASGGLYRTIPQPNAPLQQKSYYFHPSNCMVRLGRLDPGTGWTLRFTYALWLLDPLLSVFRCSLTLLRMFCVVRKPAYIVQERTWHFYLNF